MGQKVYKTTFSFNDIVTSNEGQGNENLGTITLG